MHIHDFLAAKAFLVLFFSCAYLLRFWIPRPLCFLADKKVAEVAFAAFISGAEDLVLWFPSKKSSHRKTSSVFINFRSLVWECSWSWCGNLDKESSNLTFRIFSLDDGGDGEIYWELHGPQAQPCHEVRAKPRSALQSSLESQNLWTAWKRIRTTYHWRWEKTTQTFKTIQVSPVASKWLWH